MLVRYQHEKVQEMAQLQLLRKYMLRLMLEFGYHTVRIVSLSNDLIGTYSGGGSTGISSGNQYDCDRTAALYKFPNRLWINSLGDVYVADGSNYQVKKITRSSGYVSLVTGNGTKGRNVFPDRRMDG